MLRYAFLSALLFALAAPRTAHARPSGLADYHVEVAPRDDGTAHFTIRMMWSVGVDMPRSSWSKYVGSEEPTSVVAHDAEGEPLAVAASRDRERPGWSIAFEFGSPRSFRGSRVQQAVIEFDQRIDPTPSSYAWGGPRVTLDWVTALESLGATHYRVRSVVPAGADFTCDSAGGAFFCGRDMYPPEPFEFVLTRATIGSTARDVGTVALAFALSAALLRAMLRRLRANALRERGVVPDEPLTEPCAQGGYRAPPPRPERQLTREDARALHGATVLVWVGVLGPLVPALFLHHAPIHMGVATSLFVLGATVFMSWFLHVRRARIVLAATPIVVASVLVGFGVTAACLAAVAMFFVYATAWVWVVLREDDEPNAPMGPPYMARQEDGAHQAA